MRIITGKYKGRHFEIPRTFKARPTTDFAKENIFNVLNGYIDLEGADALDLFSGTGSISLELVSRGCGRVVSVELDREHHRFIQQCFAKLGIDSRQAQLLRADAFRFIRQCGQRTAGSGMQFDLVFADPPYALKELPEIPGLVFEHDLLKDDGLLVFEHGKNHDFSGDPHFVDHRSYGSVNFSIFRKAARASV